MNRAKHTKWIVLLSYPFFLFPSFAFGQTSAPHPVFQKILSLKFDQFHAEPYPEAENDYEGLYYNNLYDVACLLLQDKKDQYDQLKSRENQRLNWLKEQKEESALKGFVAAEIKLQWAFVHLKYGKEWSAFWGLRKAQKLINENIAQYPNFEPNQRTNGALQLIFGMVPENVQWAFRFFQLTGSVKSGIASLEKVRIDTPLSYESGLIQILIQTHLLENHDRAKEILKILPYSDEPLTTYFKILIAFKANEGLVARQLLQDSNQALPYQSYFLAETYFQEGGYAEAINHYENFISMQKSGNYIKDAYTKIALSKRFLKDKNGYLSALEKAEAITEASTEIDKNAGKMIEEIAQSNDELLQLRFALDGGFTLRARQLLKKLSNQKLSSSMNVEVLYRSAQYHLLLGQIDMAIQAYQEVLKQKFDGKSPYFIPNAALQLGWIFHRQGDTQKAINYFNKVLQFDDHPYKSSLDAKAQIALSLIQESEAK